MNTQEILARVNDAMRPFMAVQTAQDSRGYNAESVMRDMHGKLRLLAEDLEAQVRREIAASKGVGNAAKIITDMCKAQESSRKSLAYPWIDAEGRQCVCDGFQAYRLREHLPLMERPDDAGQPIALEKIYPASLAGWKRLSMPSAKELRAFIAVEKAKQGGKRNFAANWDFGPNEPTVNARLLLNAATIFPDAAEIFWNTLVSPLVITCEQGDAMILPIRTDKTMKPTTEAEDKAIEAENAQKEQLRKEVKQRTEAICKAHTDADAAWDLVREAMATQASAMDRAKNAKNAAARDAAVKTYLDACETEAKARLTHYAATTVWDECHSMTPQEFANVVLKLYARSAA